MSRAAADPLAYVDQRLERWALWSASRDDGAAYYSQVRYREPEIRGNVVGVFSPALADEPKSTELAVALLVAEHRRLGLIVIARWRTHPGWSADMLAVLHHISVRTFHRDLARARLALHRCFLDQSAGLVRQVAGLQWGGTGQGAPG